MVAATITALSFGLFAGCSSGSSKTSASTATAAPTTRPVPTPTTARTQSVREVASVVAQYRGQILSAGTKLASCKALVTVNNSDDPLNVLTAKLDCQSGVLETSTPSLLLARDLAAAKPPLEVSALTEQTRTAAQSVSDIGTTYSDCLTATKTNDDILGCVINFEWDDALSALTGKLAGWDAYLG